MLPIRLDESAAARCDKAFYLHDGDARSIIFEVIYFYLIRGETLLLDAPRDSNEGLYFCWLAINNIHTLLLL